MDIQLFFAGIPKSLGTDIDEIKECILEKCPTTVVHVHEFHVWCLEPNQIICSLHVIYNDFKVCMCNLFKNSIIQLLRPITCFSYLRMISLDC